MNKNNLKVLKFNRFLTLALTAVGLFFFYFNHKLLNTLGLICIISALLTYVDFRVDYHDHEESDKKL